MSKLEIVNAIIISPITALFKGVYSPILQKRDLLIKCYNEGLYHITKEENLYPILESGYLKASNIYQSYGSKKVFMFAGIPTVEDICINSSFQIKLVAIKINPSYEQITKLFYRSKDDEAIIHKGNMILTDKQISIVYLGLSEKNGKLIYKPISKNIYDNYIPNFNTKTFQNDIVRQLKGWTLGLKANYQYTLNILKQNSDKINNHKVK